MPGEPGIANMATLLDTLRPNVAYLQQTLIGALHGRTEAKFVADYVLGLTRRLRAEPRLYRAYGPYWPAVKTILLDHGAKLPSAAIDTDVRADYSYPREALTLVAAALYEQARLERGLYYSSHHFLPLIATADDDEDYLFVSLDEGQEFEYEENQGSQSVGNEAAT